MCGRYALSADAQDIALQFDVKGKPDAFLPADWNISPTKNIYFVNASDQDGKARQLEIASWGLVPSWSKDASRASNTINARVESVAEKPSFRSAFKARRCLVPADGYYEWATELGNFKLKQPFYISNEDNSLLSMAGLYEDWANPQTGEVLTTVSIITRESVGEIAKAVTLIPTGPELATGVGEVCDPEGFDSPPPPPPPHADTNVARHTEMLSLVKLSIEIAVS